jgi:hypothetical protein
MDKLLWDSREHEMTVEAKHEEMVKALLERQVISVLQERIAILASEYEKEWRYKRFEEWTNIVVQYEMYKDGTNMKDAWMEERHARALERVIIDLFPDALLKTQEDVFTWMEELGRIGSVVRRQAKGYAHDETLDTNEVEERIAPDIVPWFNGLKKTETKKQFRSKKILEFTTNKF